MKGKKVRVPATKDNNARNVGVELLETVRRRLRLYTAAQDTTIKRVVNDAIDEYLKKRGA
jgi:hypothetical protein